MPKVSKKERSCMSEIRFLCNRLKHGAVFVVFSYLAGLTRFVFGSDGTMNCKQGYELRRYA